MAKNKKCKAIWNGVHRRGYRTYRYGSDDPSPIKLAGPQPQNRILVGEKRKTAVARTVELLRNWHQSPFENEGSTVAGFRSALCINGHPWTSSDREAHAIVAEALSILGAERPTWLQGQRHYSEPRENCKWCSCELEPGDQISGFCSEEHARFALTHWGFETKNRTDANYFLVQRAARRLSQESRKCACCGKKFKPPDKSYDQKFCSRECVSENRRNAIKDCRHCGKPFHSPFSTAIFCSRVCSDADRKIRQVERTCVCCGKAFVAKNNKASLCSNRCEKTMGRMRKGVFPKVINVPVFDYLFKQAA